MIVIRPCEGLNELAACVELQVHTWGYDASEIIPVKSFLLAQKIGGQVIGAFESGNPQGSPASSGQQLIGFAFSLPGIHMREGKPEPYLHSHMLAVRESHRNHGLGAQLKREQRQEALARGITYMEWTFDPLEIKNAFLNLHRLGAIVRGYRVNFYGDSSSRLQGGLPTDRLIAQWHMASPRVAAALSGHASAPSIIEQRIVVPSSVPAWKSSAASRHRALEVLLENRRQFQEAFARGLAVLDFGRDEDGNGVFKLGPFPSALITT